MRIWIIILGLLYTINIYSKDKQRAEKGSVEAKELEIIDFSTIKNVLEHDQLSEVARKKIKRLKKIKAAKEQRKLETYSVPDGDLFWQIASELWLVKNATLLKWNFVKPDYGIDTFSQKVFKQLGIINFEYKVLLLNTSAISHFYLPYGNKLLVILSVPFMRSLNLTQSEIAILLVEEYLRSKEHYFEQHVMSDKLQTYIGRSYMQEKKIDYRPFEKLLSRYDNLIFLQAYSFQEQYRITKKMRILLGGEGKLKKAYISLLEKIANLVESDPDYKEYVKFYPSPRVQLNWFIGK